MYVFAIQDAKEIRGFSDKQRIFAMGELVSKSGKTTSGIQYVIAPISASLRTIINQRGEATGNPKVR